MGLQCMFPTALMARELLHLSLGSPGSSDKHSHLSLQLTLTLSPPAPLGFHGPRDELSPALYPALQTPAKSSWDNTWSFGLYSASLQL